jgi:hypothetical protein
MEENSTKMDLDQIKYWLIQDRFGEMFQLTIFNLCLIPMQIIDQTKMGVDGLSDANEGRYTNFASELIQLLMIIALNTPGTILGGIKL